MNRSHFEVPKSVLYLMREQIHANWNKKEKTSPSLTRSRKVKSSLSLPTSKTCMLLAATFACGAILLWQDKQRLISQTDRQVILGSKGEASSLQDFECQIKFFQYLKGHVVSAANVGNKMYTLAPFTPAFPVICCNRPPRGNFAHLQVLNALGQVVGESYNNPLTAHTNTFFKPLAYKNTLSPKDHEAFHFILKPEMNELTMRMILSPQLLEPQETFYDIPPEHIKARYAIQVHSSLAVTTAALRSRRKHDAT